MKTFAVLAFCLAVLGHVALAQNNATLSEDSGASNSTNTNNNTTNTNNSTDAAAVSANNATDVETQTTANNTVIDQQAGNDTAVEIPPTLANSTGVNETLSSAENSTAGNNATLETGPSDSEAMNGTSSNSTNTATNDNNNNSTTAINDNNNNSTSTTDGNNNNNNNSSNSNVQPPPTYPGSSANETDMQMLGVSDQCSQVVQGCYSDGAAEEFAKLQYCDAYTKTSVCVAENKTMSSTVMTCSDLERARLEVLSCAPGNLAMAVADACRARVTQCAVTQLNATDQTTQPDLDMFKAKTCQVIDLGGCLNTAKHGAVCTRAEINTVAESAQCSAMSLLSSAALVAFMMVVNRLI